MALGNDPRAKATVFHLRRIITLIRNSTSPPTKKEIKMVMRIYNNYLIDDALKFLISNKIIEKKIVATEERFSNNRKNYYNGYVCCNKPTIAKKASTHQHTTKEDTFTL